MGSEIEYRIASLVVVVTVFCISVYYRRRANMKGGKVDRKRDGLAVLLALAICGYAGLGTYAAQMINPGWVSWARFEAPTAARAGGMALSILMIPMIVWMFRHLGDNVTATASTRSVHELVTTGPYRWIRHPLYTFGFLLWAGMGGFLANWLLLSALAAGFVVLGYRCGEEERQLLDKFGDDYAGYMKSAGRYLPRLF